MSGKQEFGMLQFKRVTIRIADNQYLSKFFRNYDEVYKAMSYWGIEHHLGTVDWSNTRYTDVFVNGFSLLLKEVYEDNPSLLAAFLTYGLDRIRAIEGVVHYSNYVKPHLGEFYQELEVLGFTWDGEQFIASVGTPKHDYLVRTRIEQLLLELGNGFIDKYHGAMIALTSNNPDSVSQGLSSMRDLISSVLHKLTESDTFEDSEKDTGKPTRKARLKHILKKYPSTIGKETELADSLAEVTDNIYQVLSKNVHSLGKKEFDVFLYAFKESEYLLYFLLSAK